MKLGEKIRYLRYAEGTLRGLGREMTQAEVVRAARRELGKTVSQSYLSQIENGARPHLTRETRGLLARFFKVHPGFLVDDPEGFHTELVSNLPARANKLHLWLLEGADRFRREPEVSMALEKLAHRDDKRRCLVLLSAILDTPDLVPRLLHVLRPGPAERHATGRVHSTTGISHASRDREPEELSAVPRKHFGRGRTRA